MDTIRIGVITSSDRASAGTYEDKSGPAIKAYFSERLANTIQWSYEVIPDDFERIKSTLKNMSDKEACTLICITGGTGPAPRDVTPEATEAVCEKMLPGFGEQMRLVSLQYVPTAILSRQTAGIRGQSLIINIPGKPKAIAECMEAVIEAIPYGVDLIGGPRIEFAPSHKKAFRPGNS